MKTYEEAFDCIIGLQNLRIIPIKVKNGSALANKWSIARRRRLMLRRVRGGVCMNTPRIMSPWKVGLAVLMLVANSQNS